ncbi:MAG: zinc ABC transporter solute-binding protein [bacterium]|nr:zinc ABC transporter solute-binding protein [bacterium]
MKTYRVILLVLLTILLLLLPPYVSAAEKVRVMVSIPPQSYFVRQIGGELVEVSSMLPEGGLPHTYEPTPKQMRTLSKANMYVKTGIEFEGAWWGKILAANPNMHVVNSMEGIALLEGHAEHEEGKHETHAYDPHIWLSPKLVKIQAESIYEGLVLLAPDNQAYYAVRKSEFLTALDELDREIRDRFSTLATRKFLIFHPSWVYFADEYDLEQIPIEAEGKEPSAAEMVRIMKMAKDDGISVIFVQPQSSRRSAETIARQIGAKVEVLDPLAADWLNNMRKVAKTLADNLK